MSYAQSIEGFAIEKTKACDEAMKRLDYIFEPEKREEDNDN